MPMLSYSALHSRFMWNTAPIISGLLFFTKRSQNYHTVFTKGVYYIDNETRDNLQSKQRIDYTLITEPDGWVTIIERNISGYSVLLQACNRQKAIDYIVMREPLPIAVNIL